MNGIHDMGGMHGMGPIVREEDEPVFHEDWEARVWGLTRAIAPWGRGRQWGSTRYEIERLPPADYLRMSYYERWFSTIVNRLLRTELITSAELAAAKADPTRPKPTLYPAPPGPAGAARLDIAIKAGFKISQRVRARNVHPEGHTRLPRYARGKLGVVVRDNGVFALQDTDVNGQSLGGKLQHVYTVRFAARELWGYRASPRDSVFVDLWEDYLERG
ncbi:MAG: nitrile hydratase subunit beta [Blastocatellia bacterium]|nr:MAG: nitrile hydratase subunit beta [Blastocatellia bacterium]